ncbi:MAG: hypothetical protein CSB49_00900 [Proteobacteria bacterium]|nr:MAG: hypothetical protein CSB49_00900 [Pseudomonadota bacterium]
MRYELFLRRVGDEDDLDDETLLALVELADARQLTLDPYRDEGGQLRGVDLGLPFDAPTSRCRELGELALELGERYALTVFDPQQTRTLTKADLDELEARFETSAGVVRMGFSPESAAPRRSSSKLWMALGALSLFLLFAGRLLSCAMS